MTIISHKRQHLFGEVVRAYGIRPQEPEVILSQLGTIVQEEWLKMFGNATTTNTSSAIQ